MLQECTRTIGGQARHCWHPVAQLLSASQKAAVIAQANALGNPYGPLTDPEEGWHEVYSQCCWCGQTDASRGHSYISAKSYYAPDDYHGEHIVKVPR